VTHGDGILSESINRNALPPQTLLLIHLLRIFILSLGIWCCCFVGYVFSFQKLNSEGLCCTGCCTNIMRPSPRSYILKRSFSPFMILSMSLFYFCFSCGCSHKSSHAAANFATITANSIVLLEMQKHSGFTFWVTDSRTSSPLSCFKKQS